MPETPIDVLGLGNAIVDVIARADDDFLEREKLGKGSMALVDEARALQLYESMGAGTIVSGGSAANTIVGVASFGGKAAFIGKVKSDETGHAFTHDLRATGVRFTTTPAATGPATARCLVLVTPDGERTMNTYLGACQNLTPADVDEALVQSATVTYLEGYLWDPPHAKEAFVKAAGIAHAAGRKVALTLSDAFCVDRYRDEFLKLMRDRTVDIVFANQHELKSLYQTADFDTAVAALRDENVLGVVTMSAEGSLVVTRGATNAVPAFPIAKLVDTTGAGDAFRAGFIYAVLEGRPLEAAMHFANKVAADSCMRAGAI